VQARALAPVTRGQKARCSNDARVPIVARFVSVNTCLYDATMTTDPAFTRTLARFQDDVRADPALSKRLHKIAQVSDFAIDTLLRQPELLDALATDNGATPIPAPELPATTRADWPRLLRRYRQAESTRIIWRDALRLDEIEQTLAQTTGLAERCLNLALSALETEFATRHGHLHDADGTRVRLVVFALGKLGGEALNFSSDLDLVYAFAADGHSDGARSLSAAEYFTRLARQLTALLDDTTADGQCYRIDLRLRPFGGAGPMVQSFAGMEVYFQREGRDWERYAWQKARPVAGDLDAGHAFLSSVQPFIYRRYLDYGALDGLREMKAMIAREVARKDLADDLKRGPGGIREIEFLIQALQLIRAGREPALREPRLLPALHKLTAAGHLSPETAHHLRAAYRFLRHLENRVQMVGDAQVHALPDAIEARERLAQAMDYPDWPALHTELGTHRAHVTREFDALLAPRHRASPTSGTLSDYWRALPDHAEPATLAAAGFTEPDAVDAALRDFARIPGVAGLSDSARARLDRVLPVLLHATAPSDRPLLTTRRWLAVLHPILRRTSYLALLDEHPPALARLVEVVTRSALLAERLAAHPVLLDELLDLRSAGTLPTHAELTAACQHCRSHDDDEAALYALNDLRQQVSFRIALAVLDQRLAASTATAHLAALADAIVAATLALARRQLEATHGAFADARFLIVGYGSLGGEEPGFGSDLDLVFLYDAPPDAHSHSPRPLDAHRWHTRLAQKLIALLGSVTGAGRLYETDMRLRPDGSKAILVSSIAQYADYQCERAWTWEHQALVRARPIAGDGGLADAFDRIRHTTLARPRDHQSVLRDVAHMRLKMRRELDRSTADHFDLKQGEGGLIDLEFILQALVLSHAHAHPELTQPRASSRLIEAMQHTRLLDTATTHALQQAHTHLLTRSLACTLDRRPRRAACDAALEHARASVRAAWRRFLGDAPVV